MGMFSYACTKCGEKSQFDYVEHCVVKIGDLYFKGKYNSYGVVEIKLDGSSKPVESFDIQFHDNLCQHADTILISTEIYCGGATDPQQCHIRSRQQGRMAMMFGGGDSDDDDQEERNCIPNDISVLDSITEAMFPKLPNKATFQDATQEEQAL